MRTFTIKLIANAKLKEQITLTPAFLVGIGGSVWFKNEKGVKELISQGDYIEANLKHRLITQADNNLILIK